MKKTQNNISYNLVRCSCVLTILLFFAVLSFAEVGIKPSELKRKTSQTIIMYQGEVRVLAIVNIDRVAVGDPKVLSNSILSEGQMVVLANAIGETTLYIWLENGEELRFDVRVLKKDKIDSYAEVRQLVRHIKGVQASKVGDMTVVKGHITLADKMIFDRVLDRYKDVLNLVVPADPYAEVSALLSGIANIKVARVGSNSVVSGEVSPSDAKLVELVASRYPTLINMCKKEDIVATKMVYMQVKIMEVTKSFTEDVGIKWGTMDISGPSFGFGVEKSHNGSTILNKKGVSDVFTKANLPNLNSASGYFGIATEITSAINLAERSGDAVTLAQPRLSARSGGKAEFLAGGEYPMPTTSTEGQVTVEFKKYGIMLKIEPIVDDRDNILAHVETEVSEIDAAVKVGNIPGIKTRSTSTDVSMLKDQTLVIAGLLNREGSSSNDDVKWLRDLPVLGPLFRSNNFQNKKTELIIFVTPTIHDVNSPENKAALANAERIRGEFDKIVEGNELMD